MFVTDDRVLETSTTTGTGAYALGGAATSYKAVGSALRPDGTTIQNGDTLPYVAIDVDGSNNPIGGYESGIGTWNSSGNTLSRTAVRRSSNSNAAVSWSAGTRLIALGSLASSILSLGDDGAAHIATITTDPAAAIAAGYVKWFPRSVAGRALMGARGNTGLPFPFQPGIWRERIGIWNPPGNATTIPSVTGFTAITSTGTVNTRNVATTNHLSRQRRLGYVSSATAGSLAGIRDTAAQITVGDGSGNGGFFTVITFGTSDAAAVSGARAFIGLSSSTSAPTNVEPNTLTNSVGIAQLSTDNTQWYLVYGGSAAQTAVALGTSLGAPTDATTTFELVLYSPPGSNGVIYYEVTNLSTGVVVSGSVGPGTAGTTTPANSTLLTYQIWRTNNATALAVGIDICQIYEALVS